MYQNFNLWKKLFIGLSLLIPFHLLTATPEVNAHKENAYFKQCTAGHGSLYNDRWKTVTADQFFERTNRSARKCRNHTRGHGQDHDMFNFYSKFSSDPRF